jgi:hypothetical protein
MERDIDHEFNDYLPKESSFYEVRYEKIIDGNGKVIWQLKGIY